MNSDLCILSVDQDVKRVAEREEKQKYILMKTVYDVKIRSPGGGDFVF
jgi:transcription elongation factor